MLPLPAGPHTRGRVVLGGQRRGRRGLADRLPVVRRRRLAEIPPQNHRGTQGRDGVRFGGVRREGGGAPRVVDFERRLV